MELELMQEAGAGLAINTSGSIPRITANSALWFDPTKVVITHLMKVEGRLGVDEILNRDGIAKYCESTVYPNDVYIRLAVLPLGWYEVKSAALPGLTRKTNFFFKLQCFDNGMIFIERISTSRERVRLQVCQGWN